MGEKSRCGISNLSFLENLTGLERLNLEGNNISDVSPLAGLTNLKWLKLTNNPITDFSSLEELSKTTNIITGEVAIPDRYLRAAIADALGKGDTTVISITFDEMSTLTELDAANKGIRDLTGLQFATNLQNIEFFGNQITELSSLANLRNLESLNLSDNAISDILPLKNLPNLRWLNLVRNQIVDLSPLENLRNLRWLNLTRNHIANLSSLKNLTQLEELSLWSNQISDISPLAGLLNLKRLDLFSNDIVDVSPLGSLHSLKHLHLNGNKISNIFALTSLHQLESLSLGSNEISDVSPLVSLHDLKSLELHHNQISNVSPLSSLHNLEKLTLHGNLISDFSPVLGLPALASITRAYNPVSPIAGTKIEGPWLWAIVPGGRWLSDTDFLAEASDGAATELKVATHGAKEGKAVGDSVWTSHTISPTGSNNINEMTAELSWGTGIEIYDHIIYGSITMYSPKEQQTHLFVGTNDAVKVWLNGELVYQDLSVKSVDNYVDYFPLTLKQGVNVLLVAVDNRGYGLFSGFWGFEEGTEYTLLPPGVGFTFSATETNLLAGDTFTLNLNAENITDLAGWQTDIAFDPNVLEAVEVTEGDFLQSEGGDTFFQGGTIDNTAGKITTLFSTRISESGVNGTGTLLSVTFKAKAGGETQVTLENFEFISITDDIIPTVPPSITITVGDYPAWDVNQDGRVSIQDLILVARDLGSNAPANLRTDVNRDGEINIQDLVLVAQHIGESTETSAAPPIVSIDNEELMPKMIEAWIEQAQTADDGSLAFRQGIENLERLLASLIPEKTALLANYPNPFNPETWIPYHLAKPADVTLTIYAANGAVVRTIALGHQVAGMYQSRSRAVYWDGRNAIGEPVASGIYFYTLTAGDYTATRKMLIIK